MTLGLTDVDHYGLGIDVGGHQADHLGYAQAGRVDRDEDRVHHQIRLSLQELKNLVARQNRRERVLGTGKRDLIGERLVADRRAVEEAQGADDRIDRARLEAAGQKVEPVVANVLDPELVWGLVVIPGKAGDGIGVDLLRARKFDRDHRQQ